MRFCEFAFAVFPCLCVESFVLCAWLGICVQVWSFGFCSWLGSLVVCVCAFGCGFSVYARVGPFCVRVCAKIALVFVSRGESSSVEIKVIEAPHRSSIS